MYEALAYSLAGFFFWPILPKKFHVILFPLHQLIPLLLWNVQISIFFGFWAFVWLHNQSLVYIDDVSPYFYWAIPYLFAASFCRKLGDVLASPLHRFFNRFKYRPKRKPLVLPPHPLEIAAARSAAEMQARPKTRPVTKAEFVDLAKEILSEDLAAIALAGLSPEQSRDAEAYVYQKYEERIKAIIDGKLKGVVPVAILIGLLCGCIAGAFAFGLRPSNPWKPSAIAEEEANLPSHRLICGETRSGKSVLAEKLIMEDILAGESCVHVADPHGPLGWKILENCVRCGIEDRVIFDELAYTDLVPAIYDFFPRSTNPDQLRRAQEEQVYLGAFLDLVTRDRPDLKTALGPRQGKYLRYAAKCWQKQLEPVSLLRLPDVFDIHSEKYFQAIDNCTDEKAALELAKLSKYSSAQYVDELLEGAKNILDPLFTSPAFCLRAASTVSGLKQAAIDKRVIIQVGGRMIAPLAVRQILGSTASNLTYKCEEYYGETGKPLPVKTWLDEAGSCDLISINDGKRLPQQLKWGAEWNAIFQQMTLDPDLLEVILQNFKTQHYFCQGSASSAKIAADQLALGLIDPDKKLEGHEKKRMQPTGTFKFRTVENHSESRDEDGRKRTGKSTNLVAHQEYELATEDAYQALNDQLLMYANKLTTLPVGHQLYKQRLSLTRTYISSQAEYVQPWEPPFNTFAQVSQQSLEAALCRIRSNPIYQRPDLGNDTKAKQAKVGAAERKRSTESGTA